MAIVPSSSSSEGRSSMWPNEGTLWSTVSIVANLMFEAIPLSRPLTLICNTPIRISAIYSSIQGKNFYKVALNISAFAALCFPYGRWIASAIDGISEAESFYHYWQLKKPIIPVGDRLQLPAPHTLSLIDAYKLFGLPEGTSDLNVITDRYNKILKALANSQNQAKSSPVLVGEIEGLIQHAKGVYERLCEAAKQRT